MKRNHGQWCHWKNLYLLAGLVGGLSFGNMNALAATWRSNSGKTQIPNLDSICWGNNYLDSVRTVFGNHYYYGDISLNNFRSSGCVPGDTLSGNFYLYHNTNYCQGRFTAIWQPNNRALLKWDIENLGGCPVGTSHWEINTYPVAD